MKFFVFILALLSSVNLLGQDKIKALHTLYDQAKVSEQKEKASLKLAKQYLLYGNYIKAKQWANTSLSYNVNIRNKEEAWLILFNIHYNTSKFNEGVLFCDSVINLKQLSNTRKINFLVCKAKAIAALNDYKLAIDLLKKSIADSEDSDIKGNAYYIYGSILSELGNSIDALNALDSSLIFRVNTKDSIGIAATYSFLGFVYSSIGNYNLALDYLYKSIDIREKYNDKRGLANSYLNLYKTYINNNELSKALEFENKSLKICKEIGDLQCVSGRLTNIGDLYFKKSDYNSSLKYHQEALLLSVRLKLINRQALVLENMAKTYCAINQFSLAFSLIDSSLQIRTRLLDNEGKASALLTKAEVFIKSKNYKSAQSVNSEAIYYAKKIKAPAYLSSAFLQAHEIAKHLNDYKSAYNNFYTHISIRDSLFNVEKSKEITRKEMQFEYEKMQSQNAQIQKQKEELNRIEKSKDKTIRIILILLSVVFISFSAFIFKLYKRGVENNKELSKVNTLLNKQNGEIESQRILLENKNKEINESIDYAANIQNALIPSIIEFKSHFKDSFIVFKPREVISGDFYWISEENENVIYITADCTGHGVPGGFMSMMGVALLAEIINDNKITEPSLILNHLRRKLIKALHHNNAKSKDGMDVSVVKIDKQTNTVTYAGANNPMWIKLKKELDTFNKNEFKTIIENNDFVVYEIPADKMPVGKYTEEIHPFKQKEFTLPKGSWIYTFTDGFADQFGGSNGKKLKYKPFAKMLIELNDVGNNCEIVMKENFLNWKSNQEQVDDVLLIGVLV